MPKDEWGVKRLCPNCATRFYDLQRNPMTCPNCASVFDVEAFTAPKSRPARTEKARVEPRAPIAPVETDDDAVVIEDEEETADVEIDDELLEEDEEDTVDLEEIADVAEDDDD